MSSTTTITTTTVGTTTGTIHLEGQTIPLTNCGTCKKLNKVQTTKHTAKNCPHKAAYKAALLASKGAVTASTSSTVQPKSAEVVNDEDEEQQEEATDTSIASTSSSSRDKGKGPANSNNSDTSNATASSSSSSSKRPANSNNSDTSNATASSSSSSSKRPATSSSSSRKKKRQQQEVESELDCQEDVTIHVLNGDLQRWSNRDILLADTAKLLRNFHDESGSIVNKKNARLMRALYLLYLDIQSQKGETTLYKGKSLTFTDFMTEVLKEAGLGKAEAEKKATKLYNQFKAGQTYHQLSISWFKLEDFPIQTVATDISAATGQTNGTTVPDKKRLYNGRPFNPKDIPKLYEEMLKEFGRPPNIKECTEFLKKNLVKQSGDEEEKPKPPTKDEIIKQLEQQVEKMEDKVGKLEEKLGEVIGDKELETFKKELEEPEDGGEE